MIVEVNDLKQEGVDIYSSLTDHELRKANGSGVFIAESPKVIISAIEAGYTPLSMLCEKRHITGDAANIINLFPNLTVYTGERETLAAITGYKLTRGVLCAMERKEAVKAEVLCRDAHRIVVIEAVCDTTNIGSIFRSAAALGVDGIILTPDSCDPLNRRSIRVSMGTVFKVPWCFVDNPVKFLNHNGFTTVALALQYNAIHLDDTRLKNCDRLAVVLGTEGDGLKAATITECDYTAIIPMHLGVDSLNVGAAAAIACWELRRV